MEAEGAVQGVHVRGGRGGARHRGRRSEGSNECVSADRDEELSDVQVSDEEEHYERSERRFGYNPDNGDLWAEYQAVMGDDWFAWWYYIVGEIASAPFLF